MKLGKSIKSSVFAVYIFSYFALSVLLIGLIGFLIYTSSTRQLEGEIVQEKTKRLEYVSELMEKSVFEPLYSITSRTALDLNENYNNYLYLTKSPAGKNVYPILVAIQNLNKIIISNPTIESITMFFLESEAIISSKAFKEDAHMFLESEFITWIENKESDLDNKWFYRNIYGDMFNQDKSIDVITYIRHYPLMSEGDNVDAYVYTNAYISEITKTFNSLAFQEKEKILLIDKNNNYVITASGDLIKADDLYENVKGDSGYEIINLEYGLSVVTWRKSSVDGWYYVIITPVADFYNFSLSVKRIIIFVCLAILILSILLSYLLSKGMYNPIKKIKEKILPNDHSGENDFKKINETIDGLNTKISQLAIYMNNSNITKFLYGTAFDDEEDLPLSLTKYSYFRVIILRVKNKEMIETMQKQFWDMLKPEPGDVFTVNNIMRPRDNREIIYIINYDGSSEKITNLKNVINDKFNAYVGIGRKVDSIYDLNVSLQSAQNALKYIYVEPERKVFDSLDFSSENRVRANLKIDYHKFGNCLVSGNIESINEILEEIVADVALNKYTYSSLEKIIFRLLASMNDFLSSINREDDLKEPNLFKWYLEHQLTFYQSIDWIKNICKQIIVMKKDKDETLNNVFEKMRSYVDDHLDEDLSLDKMASLSYFSTSYISINFKKIFGLGFSKYVYNARLEKAAHYLKDSDMSISNIIKNVGFHSLQYFTTKFKSKFGVTPNEYRKSNRRL